MRFCQVDGTPLVDDSPPADDASFDPFATIVGVAPPKVQSDPQPSEGTFTAREEAPAISEPDDVLDLPGEDPLRTMYVSDDEMKAALKPDESSPESEEVEVQPIDISADETVVDEDDGKDQNFGMPASMPEPELPSFSEPDVPAPNFGDMSPPPSPYSSGSAADMPMRAPSFDEPAAPSKTFNEAETIIQGDFANPFEAQPAAPVAEWTPPPAPEPGWENQQVGSNTPFQPPAVSPSGQNKTLPIVSLVLGIISLCCYVSPITGLAAVITGFMGMKNANNMPDVYGGKGLAIAGMILGGLLLVIGIVYWVFLLFFGGLGMIMDAAR